jgi:hypothetical protein
VSIFGRIDCLSLDIDGNDYWVLSNLDLSGIGIVVVEYNPIFGSKEAVTVPRDDQFNRTEAHHSNLYYGASLLAWIRLLDEKGYVFIGSNRVGNNAFFVSNEFSGKFNFDVSDLGRFTDWRVRESRDQNGNLSYLYGKKRFRQILGLPIVDTVSGQISPITDGYPSPLSD